MQGDKQAAVGPSARRRTDPARAPQNGDRRRGLDRAIMLLDALLQNGGPMRTAEIARAIDAPRSTTYEIVNRLLDAEILAPVGSDGGVYFGRAMHLYSHAYARQDALYNRIGEALERLSAEAAATAQVCALKGNRYIVFDSRDGPGPFRITSDVGVDVPIPWTASGRLLLGHMSDDEIRAFIPPQDYRLPDGRVVGVETFLAEVAHARRVGYCVTGALADRFIVCLAAPIRDLNGVVTMTLCLVIPVGTPETRRKKLLTLLCERARELSLSAG